MSPPAPAPRRTVAYVLGGQAANLGKILGATAAAGLQVHELRMLGSDAAAGLGNPAVSGPFVAMKLSKEDCQEAWASAIWAPPRKDYDRRTMPRKFNKKVKDIKIICKGNQT